MALFGKQWTGMKRSGKREMWEEGEIEKAIGEGEGDGKSAEKGEIAEEIVEGDTKRSGGRTVRDGEIY